MLAVGMLFGSMFQIRVPVIKTEFENANLFRSWSDPLMLLYFVHPILMGIILAWIWSKTKGLFSAKSAVVNGLCFALIYWVTATIPGMLISYSSFPISLAMVANWSISNLGQALCAGILFSKTIK